MRTRFSVWWLLFIVLVSTAAHATDGDQSAPEHKTPEPAKSKDRNWDAAVFLGYGTRVVNGTIVINRAGKGSGAATAQSLGLSNASNAQLAIDTRWKRWHLGLDLVPTSVDGQGYSLASLQLGNVGINVNTPTTTTIDVNLALFALRYAVVQTRDTDLNMGVGFGKTSLDVEITPNIGQALTTNTDTPFGFLAIELGQRLDKHWSMNVAAHGASIATNGDEIDYYDFNINGGYRVMDRELKLDVMAGFRLINFVFDYPDQDGSLMVNVQLRGPYLGLLFAY